MTQCTLSSRGVIFTMGNVTNILKLIENSVLLILVGENIEWLLINFTSRYEITFI